MSKSSSSLPRRDFMKLGALGAGGAMLATQAGCAASDPPMEARAGAVSENIYRPNLGSAPAQLFAASPMETVRIGFVGVGGMGTVHVRNLVQIEGAVIQAICDINAEHAERAKQIVEEAGFPAPTLYTRGERDFERMCAEEDLDLVYTATPWRWHVPVMACAMENGKHAATEVPAAMTIDDCWRLVELAETHQKHAVMMENCNYDRFELLMFNLVRKGFFGELLHGECGYLHDLRWIKFSEGGEGLWRREWSKTWDANLYPTHGLGPIAQCMDINRGDQFDYLVSMSTASRGLQDWAMANYPDNHPKRQETYHLGDVNTCMIKTKKGRTIYVSHDTNLPRPYSRIKMLQGTKGLMQGHPPRVHLAGHSPDHRWDEAEAWYAEHEHPLWKTDASQSNVGHGGMDFLEDMRLIHCLRAGLPTDMNVYDAAVISSVIELTKISNANGSQPVQFPDFTRGRWQNYPQLDLTT